ncbi:hypothetical protein BZA05DRAFT_174515 [Tricharina praecox]|uniref:uncharacterized protein n=1 Tax=Tricharina praecox TaxID=43433 RepID=UPI0022205B49|nr:uncharacterized protein BZA05DRAFT_174515 [Tricharina praecox]KAI5844337.1 hypothetical protein BZA05DRAFT_174515 [Tricharina praecox]
MEPSNPPLPPSFPLPAVHRELAAYVHPPAETHRTRSLLTTHLHHLAAQPRITSASGSADEFRRFLELELGRHDGVRKNYLAALRENVEAKREYAAAVAALAASEEGDSGGDGEDDDDEEEAGREADGWKQAYVDVLRLRRQVGRLTVLREGVAALADASIERPPGGLGGAYAEKPPEMPEALMPAGKAAEEAGKGGVEAGCEAVVLAVQRRIVEASEALAEETAKVGKLGNGGFGRRMDGLRAVQTELLAWLEKALTHEEVEETTAPTAEDIDMEKSSTAAATTTSTKTIAEVLQDIDAAYAGYLSARTELLEHMTDTLHTTAEPLSSEDAEQSEEIKELLASRLDVSPPLPAPQVLRVLARCEHLLPLVRTQKSLLVAQNWAASSFARRRIELTELLPSPDDDVILAANKKVEEVNTAMAAAEATAHGYNQHAIEQLRDAKIIAEELDTLCAGGSRKKAKRRGIPVRGSGGKFQQSEEEGPRGVWAGLGGGVGVIGDGI